MEHLGQCRGQPVGQGLDQDRGVVVVVRLVVLDQPVDPDPRGDGKQADEILDTAGQRGDEIGQRQARLAVWPALLLP